MANDALTVKSLKDKDDSLVLVAQDVCILATPYGVGNLPTAITVDSAGTLMPLPAGWESVGEIDQQAGVSITPDLQTSEVKGYGSRGARRVIVTDESVTVGFSPQESKALNLEMFWGADFRGGLDSNGEQLVKKSYSGGVQYWSLLVIGQDETENGVVLPYWLFPKVTVSKKDAVSLSTEDGLVYPMEFTAFEDQTFGGFVGIGHAGAGFAQMAVPGGFETT